MLMPLTVLWTLGGAGLVALAGLVLRGVFRRRAWWMVNLWGRAPLWWHGVRLEVSGAEHLVGDGPRLVLFNHVSILDLFVLARVAPASAVVVYKQEFHKIPGLGHALRALGHIPIDRTDKDSAVASISAAAGRIHAEGCSVFMAPEGTRSRKGGLQQFKLGPFHLAQQTGAPMVPMIMRGISSVLPMGSFVIRPGRVGVDLLEPIEPTGWQPEEVRERAGEVREVFLEWLEPVRE